MCVNCFLHNIESELNNIDNSIEEDAPLTSQELARIETVKERLEKYLRKPKD